MQMWARDNKCHHHRRRHCRLRVANNIIIVIISRHHHNCIDDRERRQRRVSEADHPPIIMRADGMNEETAGEEPRNDQQWPRKMRYESRGDGGRLGSTQYAPRPPRHPAVTNRGRASFNTQSWLSAPPPPLPSPPWAQAHTVFFFFFFFFLGGGGGGKGFGGKRRHAEPQNCQNTQEEVKI